MAFHVVALDRTLEGLVSGAVSASLHTTDGGTTGADEITGGTYARQAVTWDPASGGQIDAGGQFTFDVPGGYTVTHLGLWDSGGVWQGSIKLSTEESYGAAGTYTVLLVRVTQSDVTPA
ncbi:phage tail fiber protein [Nocardiopsis synnemataformans]|uniref:phage tail fiber protein n=1 Tax=Nocardiopsis synnemataformans TaxID=61305 RepID=UPI003EBEDEBC